MTGAEDIVCSISGVCLCYDVCPIEGGDCNGDDHALVMTYGSILGIGGTVQVNVE